ncbi:MAG TPA: hypothetical protein VG899_13180 [Mycobacteriales bacterium]|nr:hypothetical protein [Mycobacteriales bacterium]
MPSRRTSRAASVTAGLCLVAGAAACSGSSSPSSNPTTFASPTSPPPTSLHGHKAGGPNGVITAPASNPPSSGVPGGSETFPHVDTQTDRRILDHVLAMPGVAHAAYYPQFKQFQVYYTPSATSADRQAVYDYVTSHS